jgi:hypothetical protein
MELPDVTYWIHIIDDVLSACTDYWSATCSDDINIHPRFKKWQDSWVSIVTAVRAARPGNRVSMPGRGRNICLLQSVQTGCWARQCSSFGIFRCGMKWLGRKAHRSPPCRTAVCLRGIYGDKFSKVMRCYISMICHLRRGVATRLSSVRTNKMLLSSIIPAYCELC